MTMKGVCALDQPSGSRLPTAGSLPVSGWAFAAVGRPVPASVEIELRSEKTGQAEFIRADRVSRPDVASHFSDFGLLLSGFVTEIPLRYSMHGRYFLSVVQRDQETSCHSGPLLELEAETQSYETAARAGLANKFLVGKGIEIGALQRPLPVPPRCSVSYVDRMSYDDLIRHYPELRGLPIQQPDVLDDGETLQTFGNASQDFVIGNHLLEHCRDPIRTIQNFLRVLRQGGILYMAVPDKRYTFDITRPVTRYETLRQTYVSGQRSNIDGLYREWAEHVMHFQGQAAEQFARDLHERDYSIHYNVWTLPDLMLFLLSAKGDFSMRFDIASVVAAENEIITVLQRT